MVTEYDSLVAELDTEFTTLYNTILAQGEMTPQAYATQVMLMFQNVHRRLLLLESWSQTHLKGHGLKARRDSL